MPLSVPKQRGRWVAEEYLDQGCELMKLEELDLDELDAILGVEAAAGDDEDDEEA
jgi:hypothetical protein